MVIIKENQINKEDEELSERYKDGKHFMEDIKKQALIFTETQKKKEEELNNK